jgi:DNA-binding transcriptional MerR regulator
MGQVRKRDRQTRAREKRTRPPTPAPTTGWLIRELAEMTAVSVRTLRHYVTQGLLTPTELRGTATRYQRRELLRLLAVMRARQETKRTLHKIKRRLDELAETELEAWLRTGPLPAPVSAALGIVPEPTRRILDADADFDVHVDPIHALARWQPQLDPWQHIRLLPGLELMLGPNASPAAMLAAQKICSEYLG